MSPALAGFAACHIGKGREAGTGNLFVKSGVVRPDQNAPAIFARLIDACEAVAADAECQEISAGVKRHKANHHMINRGFRTFLEGVAMLWPNAPGYDRGDYFVIDNLATNPIPS
jgi:hypothetical protein